jgi:hypothetical protein
MRLIYLANPYHDQSVDLMEKRYQTTMEVMARIARLADDICIYSPIVTWHEIAKRHDLPKDFHWWRERDFFMLRKSAALWVVPIEGWQESFGVSQEVEFAQDTNIPVFYVLDFDQGVVITAEKPTLALPLVN